MTDLFSDASAADRARGAPLAARMRPRTLEEFVGQGAEVSAVTSGVADIRRAIDEARDRLSFEGRRTILFIDEIHRFSKSQQDALLHAVEDRLVVLIGATTENPFFEVNAPLISRSRVIELKPLEDEDVRVVLRRALSDPERGLGMGILALGGEPLEAAPAR